MNFSKMHHNGNDFVIVANLNRQIKFNSSLIKKLANRNTGIGFDQLLIVEKPKSKKANFNYKIFNNDGTEASQCGNGALCFAHYIIENGLFNGSKLTLETISGFYEVNRITNKKFKVSMGKPSILSKYKNINYDVSTNKFSLTLAGNKVFFNLLLIGNLHAIILVKSFNENFIKTVGGKLSGSQFIKDGANVNFVKVINRNQINLRVFERGSGETLSCGSGSTASVIQLQNNKLLNNKVIVKMPGGTLIVKKEKSNYFLIGQPKKIYDGIL
jgi:diaminopimelate epimerase